MWTLPRTGELGRTVDSVLVQFVHFMDVFVLCHMECTCIDIGWNNGLSAKIPVDYFTVAAGGIEMRGLGYCAVNLFNDY